MSIIARMRGASHPPASAARSADPHVVACSRASCPSDSRTRATEYGWCALRNRPPLAITSSMMMSDRPRSSSMPV